MSTPAPDTVKRLVDARDITEFCSANSDCVPSLADRKVFLSGDHQAGTWDWGLGTRDPNPNPKPLAPNPSRAALGWETNNPLTQFRPEIGEVSLFCSSFVPGLSLIPSSPRSAGTWRPIVQTHAPHEKQALTGRDTGICSGQHE
jgi:hypothetical protein